MANPNIVNVTSIVGNTLAAAVGTVATSVVSNAAASGKIFKINSLYISNIDGTSSADITVNHYGAAALTGTAIAIASTVAVAADSTLVVITKDTAIYLLEDRSIGVIASAGGDLEFVASWDEIDD